MSQDDIDALLSELGGGGASKEEAAAPVAKVGESGRVLDQDEIDRLLAAVETKAHQAKATAAVQEAVGDSSVSKPAVPATPAPALTKRTAAGAAKSEPAAAPAPAQMPMTSGSRRAPAVASPPESTPGSSVASSDAVTLVTPSLAEAKPTLVSSAASTASGALSQDDIDKLLSDLGAPTDAAVGAERVSAAVAREAAAKPATKRTTAAEAAAETKRVAAASTAAGPLPGALAPTLNLSKDDLDALMAKDRPDTQTGTEMIAQSDIDALVKQLTQANGPAAAPEAAAAPPSPEELAKHAGDIDRILAQNPPAAPATADAIELRQTPNAGVHAGMPAPQIIPAHAPIELRGARYLLAAAVLLLSVCATTLFLVVRSLGHLTAELRQERTAQLLPTDSFADDLRAAVAALNDADPVEAAKGEQLMLRLQRLHPAHSAELAGLLARFYRRGERHALAVRQYALLDDPSSGDGLDPRQRLDYADSLTRSNETPAAVAQLYLLLSSEADLLAAKDVHGHAKTSDIAARDLAVVQESYLQLGRIFDATRGTVVARHDAGPGHDPAPGHSAPGHSAPGHAAPGPGPAAAHAPAPASKPAHGPAPAPGAAGH